MKTITYKDLINKWFAQLDKGYANPPYTKEEWDILESLKREYTIITEAEPETPEKPEKEKSTEDDRFVAKTALFMDSPEAFTEYIITNYTNGVQIPGLELVFQDLSKLTPEKFQDVAKIINSGTNRNPDDGSFGMGENEQTLMRLLIKHVQMQTGDPTELFLAIVLGGRIKAGTSETGDSITSNVDIDGTRGIIVKDFALIPELDFGKLSPEAIEALEDVFEMANVVLDQQQKPELQRDSLNDIFRLMSDPEIIAEINELLKLYQTTEIKVVQRLGKKVANILGDKSPEQLVITFFNLFDEYLRTKITQTGYWSTVDSEKFTVYLEPSSDIYSILKSDIENRRISRAISNLESYFVKVKGESINKKLLA
jgi:hypothetical protein